MLEFKEVTITDKQKIDQYLSKQENSVSELTFANLFMWRVPYQIHWAESNGCMLASYEKNGELGIAFPIGGGDHRAALEEALAYFRTQNRQPLFYLYSEFAHEFMKTHYDGTVLITNDEGANDYVYLTTDLIELPGKKYHQKRNHISAFYKMYPYSYEKLTPENIPECIELFEEWYRTRMDTPDIHDDLEAKRALFSHYEELGVIGGLIRVLGEVAAVDVGEALNSNTFVVHAEFAHANLRGAFAVINQEFARHECAKYTYINREEDMGIEGIRRAKRSYYPVMMAKKYRAVFPE
jgi:hypothetical protein